jgi:hypothetical protein
VFIELTQLPNASKVYSNWKSDNMDFKLYIICFLFSLIVSIIIQKLFILKRK